MKHTYFLNGKPADAQMALKFFDPSAPAIFETLRIYRGKIFREEEHLERLRESAQTAGLAAQLSIPEARRAIRLAVKGYGRPGAALRATWNPGFGFLIMIGERPVPAALYETGVKLKTSPVTRSHSNASPPEVKAADYMNAVLATLEPKPQEIYEWVFLDHQGYVTEVRIGNLFIADRCGKKPRLRTPPLRGILNGVTRRFVIECALLEGIDVLEEPLTRHEIYNAAEVFLTNTSWEILPVQSLDGRTIAHEIPGRMTRRLHRRFRKRVMRECR